jgi:hypothetical protein
VENLDHAPNEELLLLCRASLPVVWLLDRDDKANVPRPLFALRFLLVLRVQMHKVLDEGQILHVPRLAYGEGPVCIFPRLVESYTARRSH